MAEKPEKFLKPVEISYWSVEEAWEPIALDAVPTQDKPLLEWPLHILDNLTTIFLICLQCRPFRHITCPQIPFHFMLKKKAKIPRGTFYLLYCPFLFAPEITLLLARHSCWTHSCGTPCHLCSHKGVSEP